MALYNMFSGYYRKKEQTMPSRRQHMLHKRIKTDPARVPPLMYNFMFFRILAKNAPLGTVYGRENMTKEGCYGISA
jgi:hypothetical protein